MKTSTSTIKRTRVGDLKEMLSHLARISGMFGADSEQTAMVVEDVIKKTRPLPEGSNGTSDTKGVERG